jgi:prolipoprotein diacylglyceryltransferase
MRSVESVACRDLPWGIAFPEWDCRRRRFSVHPTQIYEAVALVPLAVLLFRWRWGGRTDLFVLGMYLVLAGAIRFVIEFVRVNLRVLGPLPVGPSRHAGRCGAVLTLIMRTAHARSSLSA